MIICFSLVVPDHIRKMRDEGLAAILSTDIYASQETHMYRLVKGRASFFKTFTKLKLYFM